MVVITVTQILRFRRWYLRFGYLERRRYVERMLGVTGRRHLASVAKGRGGGVCVCVFGTRWEDAKYGSDVRIALCAYYLHTLTTITITKKR